MILKEGGFNYNTPKIDNPLLALSDSIKASAKGKKIIEKGGFKFIQNDDGSLTPISSYGVEDTTGANLLSGENINNYIDSQEKEKTIQEIDKNYPILKLLKEFQNGGEYNAMIFTGIKELNDKKNQSFTDQILFEFKAFIHREDNKLGLKIVFDDYKNFIVAKSDGTNLNSGDNLYLQKILDEIFYDNLKQKYPQDPMKNSIKVFSKKGKIGPESSQVDVITSIAKTRSNLEKQAAESDGIVITKDIYEIPILEQNIKRKYLGSFTENIKIGNDTEYNVEKGVLTKKFKINGSEITEKIRIFERKNGAIVLNGNIINIVRKSQMPENLELYKDIKILIKSCIIYGEFIFPGDKNLNLLKNGEVVDQIFFDNYIKIITEIEKGNTPSNIFEFKNKTYKGALNKESFYKSINEEGRLFFIDVKGMGTENIRDFLDIITKTVKNNTLDTEDKKLEYILLNSGDIMTNKIKNFVYFIKELFGDIINIYVGGDEIIFFIPKIGEEHDKNSLHQIFQKTENFGLDIRLTTKTITKTDLNNSGEENVSELDELTKLSKILEKRIDLLKEIIELNNLKGEEHIRNFNLIKNFILFKENGKIYIDFINNPFEGNKIFEVSEIINLEKNELISDSIFIKFLEEKFKIIKNGI